MYPFIETICIEEGKIDNLAYHNRRMNKTRQDIFGSLAPLDLADYIVPEPYRERTKCRVEYGATIGKVEYDSYRIRPVRSLQAVSCDAIEYRYKSGNRDMLNRLFAQRGECDDILIVKNGFLTDTSICNVAFWNGSVWLTPRIPLLEGIRRAYLLEKEEMVLSDIRTDDLSQFSRVRLYNALINFGEIEFSVDNIAR